MDVFEVDVKEMVCCSSGREDKGVDIADGNAGGLRLTGAWI